MNAPANPLKSALGWTTGLSVVMIVAGLLAIVIPQLGGIAVTLLVGWLLLFGGVAHLVFAWHTRTAGAVVWEVLLSIAYLLAGGYLLLNPLVGMASLTLALAIYLFAKAILEFILSFQLRPLPGSGWLLVDGIITLILAIMIWKTWPSSTAWVLGTLVGVSILFSGISRLMLSLFARHAVDEIARS